MACKTDILYAMAIVVPTITAENAHVYREQIERVQPFAKQIHVDLMDGVFTPNRSLDSAQVWWPEGLKADIHIMYENPLRIINSLLALKPNLIIVQAECRDDISVIRAITKDNKVRLGISLLANTAVDSVANILPELDQLLVFSGNLGYQGGSSVDLNLLTKVAEAKAINPQIELAWDGGLNNINIQKVAEAGVSILNVGSYIHTANDPEVAYSTLSELLA